MTFKDEQDKLFRDTCKVLPDLYRAGGIDGALAHPLNTSVKIRPIFPEDVEKIQSGIVRGKVPGKNVMDTAGVAIAFVIMAVGPDVKNPEIKPGKITVVEKMALDRITIMPRPEFGIYLTADEQDLTHFYDPAELAAAYATIERPSELVSVHNHVAL